MAYPIRGRLGFPAVVILSAGLLNCSRMSETATDESVGFNGGFEVVREGLPVNWTVYTPRTIPTGDYDLVIDENDFQDGRQSLRFVVRECSAEGGHRSPGLSKEIPATGGDTYRIGFWVTNDGAEFRSRVGGVTATEGEYELIVQSGETIGSWRHYEHELTLPTDADRLRFEVNVLRPGTFSIDAVSIEPVG